MKAQFLADVDAGLSKQRKSLPSKYFYDKNGDALFMQIMDLPEYYLTRAEMEIFTQYSQQMIASFAQDKFNHFELIELGAGDGSKTKKLLKALLEQGYQFDYIPIDISSNVLEHLESDLLSELPRLSIKPKQGDYFKKLSEFKDSHHPKVVLFLGSNIGNFRDHQSAQFIYELGTNLAIGDKLLIGVDRIKSADIVLPAYDDEQGITREFNLNLLHRINRELNADFDPAQFDHVAEYTEEEGVARSYLQSKINQLVMISDIGKTYHFMQGEKIHTEISRKYDTAIMNKILQQTDFTIIDELSDGKRYFTDYIMERH